MKNYKFESLKFPGKATSADAEATSVFPPVKLKAIIEQGEYLLEQIIDCDETRSFKMPNRTVTAGNQPLSRTVAPPKPESPRGSAWRAGPKESRSPVRDGVGR